MPQPVTYDEFGRPIMPRKRILAVVLNDHEFCDEEVDEQFWTDLAHASESRRQPVYNFGSINWTTT